MSIKRSSLPAVRSGAVGGFRDAVVERALSESVASAVSMLVGLLGCHPAVPAAFGTTIRGYWIFMMGLLTRHLGGSPQEETTSPFHL